MRLQKASRSTLAGQVVAQMEQMIESGQWKIGDKIPAEPELMELFEVSRNTLREGVQSLVHVGLLETRQGIGTTVKSNSNLTLALEKKIQKSDLLETMEVRLGLEREAAQLACKRRTEEDLKQIQICLIACKEVTDPFQFAQMDIAFHKSVVHATHNKIFIELYEHITDALQISINQIMRAKNLVDYEKWIHTDLFEAIKARDSQLALESVNHYLQSSIKALRALIEQKGN